MKLELFVMDGCPYCRKVLKFVDEKGLRSKMTVFDILKDEAAGERLKKINDDDDQVPCLVIDGKPMLESDDIIEWLGKNLK